MPQGFSLGEHSLLDVGCGKKGRSLECFLKDNDIIGLDLHNPEDIFISHPKFDYIQADAENMHMFEKNEFDISFCIGVLEHITDKNKLRKITEEIKRVSKQYVIMVPHRYSIIEPHYKLPFFAFYPYDLKVSLTQLFNPLPYGNAVRSDPNFIKKDIHWLSEKEWKKYFPEAKMDFILFQYLLITKRE